MLTKFTNAGDKGDRSQNGQNEYDYRKVTGTAYYAGEKRDTYRVTVFISMSANHFME